MQRFRFTFFLCFIVLANTLSSQSFIKQTTFTVSFFNHSIGIPIKDAFKLPINLGVTTGVEFSYTNDPIPKHIQRFELGWFRHKEISNSVWIKSDYVRRYTNKNGFSFDFQGGLGIIKDFNYNQTFVLNSNGQYESIKDKGNYGMLVSLGFGAAYDININDEFSITPFLRYEGIFQTPYSSLLPFLPHSIVNVGSRFKL